MPEIKITDQSGEQVIFDQKWGKSVQGTDPLTEVIHQRDSWITQANQLQVKLNDAESRNRELEQKYADLSHLKAQELERHEALEGELRKRLDVAEQLPTLREGVRKVYLAQADHVVQQIIDKLEKP